MTIYSAGVGEKKVDFIQDEGKTKRQHLSPRSKAYTYHLPPSHPPLFLIFILILTTFDRHRRRDGRASQQEGEAGISDSGEDCFPPCGQACAARAAAAAQASAALALAVRPAAG